MTDRRESLYAFWRFNHKARSIREGRRLRLETLVPTIVHWSADGWRTVNDTHSRATGLGEYVTDLATEALPADSRIDFTFYWSEVDRWEHSDFRVLIE